VGIPTFLALGHQLMQLIAHVNVYKSVGNVSVWNFQKTKAESLITMMVLIIRIMINSQLLLLALDLSGNAWLIEIPKLNKLCVNVTFNSLKISEVLGAMMLIMDFTG